MKVLNIIQRYSPAIGGSEKWCQGISQFAAQNGIITKVATINLYDIEDFFREAPPESRHIKLGSTDFINGVFVSRYNLWDFYTPKLTLRIVDFLLERLKLHKTEFGFLFKCSPHSFQMYRDLGRQIQDSDIVHLHTFPYFHNIIGYYIARALGKKIVITPHFHPQHSYYEKRILFKILKSADKVIADSEFEKAYLVKKGVQPNRVIVTGGFIEGEVLPISQRSQFLSRLIEKYQIGPQAKKIIFIGKKVLYKGIGTLIEAVEKLSRDAGSEICLFLVGPDTYEFSSEYPELTFNKRLKVIDLKVISEAEKEELLDYIDLLVLPSSFEAFGITFLEAWKHAKPVIGSDQGAIPGIIEGAGLSVRYGDVDDLKDKIETILQDQRLARRLGECGKEKTKAHTIEKVASRVIKTYDILKKRDKVLIVTHLFPPFVIGGSEIVAYEQAKMLKKEGFQISVFAGKLDPHKTRHSITREKGEFEVTRVNLDYEDFNSNYINFEKEGITAAFEKLIIDFSPDIIHYHNIYALTMDMLAVSSKMNIPSIMTMHDFWGICYKNILVSDDGQICDKEGFDCEYCAREGNIKSRDNISLAERNNLYIGYLNKLDLIISPSKYLIERFIERGVARGKTEVINNGIDIERFKGVRKARSKKLRLGFIGHIALHKGIENMLVAVSLLSQEEKEKIVFYIIGEGEKDIVDYCRRLVKQCGLSKNVIFYGKLDNSRIRRAYTFLDALVVPSVWPENSPVTIMEAMATGTPVLASDVGGIPELVQDNLNGFLHKYDNPASLTENLRKIIRRPAILKEMKQACLDKVKENNLSGQVARIADEYRRILEFQS